MKTIFHISILAVLLGVAAGPCFAARSIGFVSKEQAKELGLEMRFTANGPNDVWVELVFKPEGKFKDFSHVELEVGDVVSYVPLRERRSSTGESVVVSFLAKRANLDKASLTVVVNGLGGEAGSILRVKDFVEPEKIR